MKKGAIEISATLLATFVFLFIAVFIVILIFGTFSAEFGRPSAESFYRVVDWIISLLV